MSTKYNTPFVQKPDKGTLKATQTKYNDKSPDYYGDIHVNLKDLTNIEVVNGNHVIKLSGWKKTDVNGKTYLSLSVKRFVPKEEGGVRQENQRQSHPEDDSDIPF